MVVLPVFLQAPWVHLYPITACLFTFIILGLGDALARAKGGRWVNLGSLLVGVSGSWLGGCLFWGWLRSYPVFHIPVEAVVLPIAVIGLDTKWRIGAGFYLASLLGTALTDMTMVLTGVMDSWPVVVNASMKTAPAILNKTAEDIFSLSSICWILLIASLIFFISRWMSHKAQITNYSAKTWIVASAALVTTLWVDGLFLITALIEPRLSGLI
tara:strand:+ start:3371 stop:4009 length:639 start_codon:yes stop_codon:yes gene_type:complete